MYQMDIIKIWMMSNVQKNIREKHKGQVFILDKLICFSNLSIFFFSFLSLSILWAARLQACETPDSLRPKYYPMSFNFSPVYL